MAVKVSVKISSMHDEVTTSALANAGFEAEEVEVILPVRVAERLHLYPTLPSGARVERYVGIGGVSVNVFRISNIVKISVISEDREVGPVEGTVVITPGEDEVILSDKAIDQLKIDLVKPGEGLWRFTDDPQEKIRKSVSVERW